MRTNLVVSLKDHTSLDTGDLLKEEMIIVIFVCVNRSLLNCTPNFTVPSSHTSQYRTEASLNALLFINRLGKNLQQL